MCLVTPFFLPPCHALYDTSTEILLCFCTMCTIHDSPKKNHFIGPIQSGIQVPEASVHFCIPYSTPYALWNRYKATSLTHMHSWSGRPPKVMPWIKRSVIHHIQRDRKAQFQEIRQRVHPVVSAAMVHVVVEEAGLHIYVACKVPYLSPTKFDKKERPGPLNLSNGPERIGRGWSGWMRPTSASMIAQGKFTSLKQIWRPFEMTALFSHSLNPASEWFFGGA